MFPEHMLSVRATVEPGREAEFDRWYDSEHVPDAVRMLPGCLGAARYRVVLGDGSHQYMRHSCSPCRLHRLSGCWQARLSLPSRPRSER